MRFMDNLGRNWPWWFIFSCCIWERFPVLVAHWTWEVFEVIYLFIYLYSLHYIILLTIFCVLLRFFSYYNSCNCFIYLLCFECILHKNWNQKIVRWCNPNFVWFNRLYLISFLHFLLLILCFLLSDAETLEDGLWCWALCTRHKYNFLHNKSI
jgi:hypothetical protein